MDRGPWLEQLGIFILEANEQGWAGSKENLISPITGFKVSEYERWPWSLVDLYSGYFRAPGFTIVYYGGVAVWTQSYAGMGMALVHYGSAKGVFDFLKEALLANDNSESPFRGPSNWGAADGYTYSFRVTGRGALGTPGTCEDLLDCEWFESISASPHQTVFTQTGSAAVIIGKDDDKKPIYPWATVPAEASSEPVEGEHPWKGR